MNPISVRLVFLFASAGVMGLCVLAMQSQGPVGVTVVEAGRDGVQQILVPAGAFTMGLLPSDAAMLADRFRIPRFWFRREEPARRIWLPGFLIDRIEVTNEKYRQFVLSVGQSPPKDWTGTQYLPRRDDHPVVNVSRQDAEAFCRWMGRRLPSEREWEKASRGPTARYYPWGDVVVAGYANTVETRRWDTAPVGSFPNDRSPYGVMDMAGNVSEWVADDYLPYSAAGSSGKPQGKVGIARGGSWRTSFLYARTTDRIAAYLRGNPALGFRCAADLGTR